MRLLSLMLLFVAVTAQDAGVPQLPDDEEICIGASVLEAFLESGSQNVTCVGEVTSPLRKGYNATISDCICPNSTLVTQVEDAVDSLCGADAKARVEGICGNAAPAETPSATSTAGPSSSSSANAAPGSSAGASGTTTGGDSISTQTVTPSTGGGEAAVVVSKVMTGLAIFAPLLIGWMYA